MSFKKFILPLVKPFCADFGALLLARGVEKDFTGDTRLQEFSATQTIGRKLPLSLEEDQAAMHQRFEKRLSIELQPQLIAQYKDGWATVDGSHISRENRLIEEISMHYKQSRENHPALNNLRPFRRIQKTSGRVLSLTGKAHYNYYHWMIEVLPKWEILKNFVDESAAIFSPKALPFQKRSLELIKENRPTINADRYPVIRAKKIIGTSIPLPEGHPQPWAVKFVRELFLKNISSDKKTPQKIFVSRQSTKTRRVENFQEIETWCAKNNFTIVELEKLSIDEQVLLFKNAQFIVAPHGAGLTNLLFCSARAKVIEIVGDDEAHPEPFCFWALSEILQLQHGCLRATAIANPDQKRKAHEKNYRVDTEKLDRLYQKMGRF